MTSSFYVLVLCCIIGLCGAVSQEKIVCNSGSGLLEDIQLYHNLTSLDTVRTELGRTLTSGWVPWLQMNSNYSDSVWRCDLTNFTVILTSVCLDKGDPVEKQYSITLTVVLHDCCEQGNFSAIVSSHSDSVYTLRNFNQTTAWQGQTDAPTRDEDAADLVAPQRRLLQGGGYSTVPPYTTAPPIPCGETGVLTFSTSTCTPVDIIADNPYFQQYENATVWVFQQLLENDLARLEGTGCPKRDLQFYVRIFTGCVQVGFTDAEYDVTLQVFLPQTGCQLKATLSGRLNVPFDQTIVEATLLDYEFANADAPWQPIAYTGPMRKLQTTRTNAEFADADAPWQPIAYSGPMRKLQAGAQKTTTRVTAWQQCGGPDGSGCKSQGGSRTCTNAPWAGYTCTTGYQCTRVSDAYWQCQTYPVTTDPDFVPGWGQCGGTFGEGCKSLGGTRVCLNAPWAGYVCQKGYVCVSNSNPAYWQCQPGGPGGVSLDFPVCPLPTDDALAFQPLPTSALRSGDALGAASAGFKLALSAKKVQALPKECQKDAAKAVYEVTEIVEGCSQPLPNAGLRVQYRFSVKLPVCGYTTVAFVNVERTSTQGPVTKLIEAKSKKWTKVGAPSACAAFPGKDTGFLSVSSPGSSLLVNSASKVWEAQRPAVQNQFPQCDFSNAQFVQVGVACEKVEATSTTFLFRFGARQLQCQGDITNTITGFINARFSSPVPTASPTVIEFAVDPLLLIYPPLEPPPFSIPENVDLIGTVETNFRRRLQAFTKLYSYKGRTSGNIRG